MPQMPQGGAGGGQGKPGAPPGGTQTPGGMGNPNSSMEQQKFDPSTMPGIAGGKTPWGQEQPMQMGRGFPGGPPIDSGYGSFQPMNPTQPMMENQGGFDANSMVSQRPEGYGTQLSELAGRSIPTPMEKSAQSYGPTLQPQQKKKGGK